MLILIGCVRADTSRIQMATFMDSWSGNFAWMMSSICASVVPLSISSANCFTCPIVGALKFQPGSWLQEIGSGADRREVFWVW